MRKVMEVTAVLQYLAIGQSALTHQSNSFHDPTVTLFCWLHMSLKVQAVMLKLLIQVFGSLYRPNVSPLTICVVRPVLVTKSEAVRHRVERTSGGTAPALRMRVKHRGSMMLKILTAMAASLAMLSAAAAADLPRKEPPPPAPPVGKAPIGKYPVGKAPIGKYPQPVVTKG